MTTQRTDDARTRPDVQPDLESIWDRPVLPIPRIAPLAPNGRRGQPETVKVLNDRVRRLHTLVLWTLAALILSGMAIALGVGPSTNVTTTQTPSTTPLRIAELAARCEQAVEDADPGQPDTVEDRQRWCQAAAAAALAAASGLPDAGITPAAEP